MVDFRKKVSSNFQIKLKSEFFNSFLPDGLYLIIFTRIFYSSLSTDHSVNIVTFQKFD